MPHEAPSMHLIVIQVFLMLPEGVEVIYWTNEKHFNPCHLQIRAKVTLPSDMVQRHAGSTCKYIHSDAEPRAINGTFTEAE